MLLIPCPWCGPRNEDEFHYGGQAGIAYPDNPAALSDVDWAAYLFFRDNPKGAFAERWVHSAGCRRWFPLIRDTATNELLPAAVPNELLPAAVPNALLPGGPELDPPGADDRAVADTATAGEGR